VIHHAAAAAAAVVVVVVVIHQFVIESHPAFHCQWGIKTVPLSVGNRNDKNRKNHTISSY
jgi:hypothetical protein